MTYPDRFISDSGRHLATVNSLIPIPFITIGYSLSLILYRYIFGFPELVCGNLPYPITNNRYHYKCHFETRRYEVISTISLRLII